MMLHRVVGPAVGDYCRAQPFEAEPPPSIDMLISAHLKLHRAEAHDFPWREVVKSALGVADEMILVCPPEDDDGTRAACEALARDCPQVRLVLMDWWKPKERGWESLADAVNAVIPLCRGRYHLNMEADEIIHESQYATLRAIAENGLYPWVEFERLNFWGSFDVVNANRKRWPCSVVRMARTDLFPIIRSYGDGCHLGILDVDPNPYPRLDARGLVQLWHYAYVRKPAAFFSRHTAMADLYGLGPDPNIMESLENGRIDWWKIVPRNEFVPIPGEHPAVMREWIAERRECVESGRLE